MKKYFSFVFTILIGSLSLFMYRKTREVAFGLCSLFFLTPIMIYLALDIVNIINVDFFNSKIQIHKLAKLDNLFLSGLQYLAYIFAVIVCFLKIKDACLDGKIEYSEVIEIGKVVGLALSLAFGIRKYKAQENKKYDQENN